MKALVVVFCFMILTNGLPTYPVHPGVGAIYKGPDSETIIKGPDGSVITSAAEGGSIIIEPKPVAEPVILEQPAAIVEPLPVTEAANIFAKVGPIVVADVAPLIVENNVAPLLPEPVGFDAVPHTASEVTADIVGPSGTISTRGSKAIISGPASTTITGPETVAHVPLVETYDYTAPVPVAPPIYTPAISAPASVIAAVSVEESVHAAAPPIIPYTALQYISPGQIIDPLTSIISNHDVAPVVSTAAVSSVTRNSIPSVVNGTSLLVPSTPLNYGPVIAGVAANTDFGRSSVLSADLYVNTGPVLKEESIAPTIQAESNAGVIISHPGVQVPYTILKAPIATGPISFQQPLLNYGQSSVTIADPRVVVEIPAPNLQTYDTYQDPSILGKNIYKRKS